MRRPLDQINRGRVSAGARTATQARRPYPRPLRKGRKSRAKLLRWGWGGEKTTGTQKQHNMHHVLASSLPCAPIVRPFPRRSRDEWSLPRPPYRFCRLRSVPNPLVPKSARLLCFTPSPYLITSTPHCTRRPSPPRRNLFAPFHCARGNARPANAPSLPEKQSTNLVSLHNSALPFMHKMRAQPTPSNYTHTTMGDAAATAAAAAAARKTRRTGTDAQKSERVGRRRAAARPAPPTTPATQLRPPTCPSHTSRLPIPLAP